MLVGAAIGTNSDDIKRAKTLIDNGVDLIVIDTAHGHSKKVLDTLSNLKKRKFKTKYQYVLEILLPPRQQKTFIILVLTLLKVGIGPGSICTTRMVAGIGVPQITAIMEVYKSQ